MSLKLIRMESVLEEQKIEERVLPRRGLVVGKERKNQKRARKLRGQG